MIDLGVAPNIYSTLIYPSFVSVGNGGCILGLIGAISVETSIYEDDDLIEDELMTDEEDQTRLSTMIDQGVIGSDFPCILIFSFGIVIGLILVQLLYIYCFDSMDPTHDWPNLYGGIMMGMILGSMINFFSFDEN